MNQRLQSDLDQLDVILEEARRAGLRYLRELPHLPTSTVFPETVADELPDHGVGAEAALRHFEKKYAPLMVASSGPRYWGYVTGGATPAAIVGDWLAAVYDQNTQATDGTGDISAKLEVRTIDLLLDLFRLPREKFWGGFVTGATMSNFTCLGVARQWCGRENGQDIARDGLGENSIRVLAATPHSSTAKAMAMLGLGRANIRLVKTLDGNREAICPADLERQLGETGDRPVILISSGGTVNTVDFDDFSRIRALRERYRFWWHVDAAFGGFAACSEEQRHLLTDWEGADSITVDCHKWMNVPYESAVFFVDRRHARLQTETFQNANAPYLGNPFDHFSYLNLLPENSRRLKALATWFSLMAYGRDGYRDIVENCVKLARELGRRIDAHPRLRLLAPVRLNTVCFTLEPGGAHATSGDFLRDLNHGGKVFMTPARYRGEEGIRAALVNWRTTLADVDLVWEEMLMRLEGKSK